MKFQQSITGGSCKFKMRLQSISALEIDGLSRAAFAFRQGSSRVNAQRRIVDLENWELLTPPFVMQTCIRCKEA